jgi:hypothetical protein
MNNLLGDRPMFSDCACLNLSVQAIRQILDIQGSHKFLQNASSMEETTGTVKLRDFPAADEVRAGDQSKDGEADRPDGSAECIGESGQSDSMKVISNQ